MVIEHLDNATYYLENTESYTVAIGLYDNYADCSIRDFETNTINSVIVPMEQINSILPQVQTRSSEKDKIMAGLYNAGWPKSYLNYLRASMTKNGVTAKLYHSVTYNIKDYDYTFVVAKTALSVLMALTGLPTAKLKLIISLALTADGIYQTVKDINVGKFDTYAYENKNVMIGDVQPYWAGRTVKWTAITGDIGAALTFDYENKHNDFDDNNALLETGLRNY